MVRKFLLLIIGVYMSIVIDHSGKYLKATKSFQITPWNDHSNLLLVDTQI